MTPTPAHALFTGRRAVTNDPNTFSRPGVWADNPLVAVLDGHTVTLVVAGADLAAEPGYRYFSPAMKAAILARYQRVASANGYSFYVPRQTKEASRLGKPVPP